MTKQQGNCWFKEKPFCNQFKNKYEWRRTYFGNLIDNIIIDVWFDILNNIGNKLLVEVQRYFP